jgi:hypothetical protein
VPRVCTNSASILSLSRFFRSDAEFADQTRPTIESVDIDPVITDGMVTCRFNVSDEEELGYANLFLGGSSVAQASLSGRSASSQLRFWRYEPGSSKFEFRVYDRSGNFRILPGEVTIRAGGNRAPHPFVTASSLTLRPRQRLKLSAAESSDPDGPPGGLLFAWDLDGDGQLDTPFARRPEFQTAYANPGRYRLTCDVRDGAGAVSRSSPLVINVSSAD